LVSVVCLRHSVVAIEGIGRHSVRHFDGYVALGDGSPSLLMSEITKGTCPWFEVSDTGRERADSFYGAGLIMPSSLTALRATRRLQIFPISATGVKAIIFRLRICRLSGGSNDQHDAGECQQEGNTVVWTWCASPPFSPEAVVEDFSKD
jgi:hypothetical protein